MLAMTISLYDHLQVAAVHILLLCTSAVDAFSTTSSTVVPEVHPTHVAKVSQLVQAALGDGDDSSSRYALARDAVNTFQTTEDSPPSNNELVYGELSVEVLATIWMQSVSRRMMCS